MNPINKVWNKVRNTGRTVKDFSKFNVELWRRSRGTGMSHDDFLNDYVNTMVKKIESGDIDSSDFVIDAIKRGRRQRNKLPLHTSFLRNPTLGVSRLALFNNRKTRDLFELRELGQTHWVEKYKRAIKHSILKAELKLKPREGFKREGEEGEGTVIDEEKLARIKHLMFKPNTMDTYRDFISQYVDDSIDMDNFVTVKVFGKREKDGKKNLTKSLDLETLKEQNKIKTKRFEYKNQAYQEEGDGIYKKRKFTFDKPVIEENDEDLELISLKPVDPITMVKWPDKFGELPNDRPVYFQYSLVNRGQDPIAYFNREVAWLSMNATSYSFYGKSPLMALTQVVKNLGNATKDNSEYYEDNVLPKAIITFLNAQKESMKRNIRKMVDKFIGKNQKSMFTNKEVSVNQLRPNNKDMDWLEGMKFYDQQVSEMLGVPKDILGDNENSNLNTSRVNRSNYFEVTIEPHLKKLEELWNVYVIPEFYTSTGEPEVKAVYDYTDRIEKGQVHEEQRKDIESGVKSPNDVREERGLERVEGLDVYKNPNSAANSFLMESNEDFTSKSLKKKNNVVSKKKRVGSGSPIDLSEAKNYSDLLKTYYNKIFRNVQSELNDFKSVNEFESGISKEFNTFSIRKDIERVFDKKTEDALESIEKDLDLNIVNRPDLKTVSSKLAEQQLNGYASKTFTWLGLKNVNSELQERVMNEVLKGVNEGESIPSLKERVKKVSDFADSRAEKIARTETNRVMNTSRLAFAASSDLNLEKEWVAAIDSRTSDVCKRLNGQTKPLGEDFSDSVSGWKGLTSPAHVNCRSVVVFKRVQ